jgi:hypothetical protein
MRRESTPPGEDVHRACPRLGHPVPFSYCRAESGTMPCAMAIHCWYDQFLVEDYFRRVLTPEEWEEVFDRPPKSRITRLLEIVEETGACGG